MPLERARVRKRNEAAHLVAVLVLALVRDAVEEGNAVLRGHLVVQDADGPERIQGHGGIGGALWSPVGGSFSATRACREREVRIDAPRHRTQRPCDDRQRRLRSGAKTSDGMTARTWCGRRWSAATSSSMYHACTMVDGRSRVLDRVRTARCATDAAMLTAAPGPSRPCWNVAAMHDVSRTTWPQFSRAIASRCFIRCNACGVVLSPARRIPFSRSNVRSACVSPRRNAARMHAAVCFQRRTSRTLRFSARFTL